MKPKGRNGGNRLVPMSPLAAQQPADCRFAFLYLFFSQAGKFVWKDQPLVGHVEVVIRNQAGPVIAWLVPRTRDPGAVAYPVSVVFPQFFHDGSITVTGIEHVIDDQYLVVLVRVAIDVVEPRNCDIRRPIIDPGIGFRPDGNVIGWYAQVFEILLHGYGDGGATTPDTDDQFRPKSTFVNAGGKPEGILQ